MTDSIARLLRFVVLLSCVSALAVHWIGLRRETIQLDEFEHVHAAWLVSQGQTPYTDFFQHHTPLFYYAGGLVLKFMRPGFEAILNLRLFMLVLTVLTAAAGWLWLRRYGRIHGLLAVCLLAANSTMLSLGHTIFLDTISVPFLVASAMLMAGGDRKTRWMLASGICFGFAVLCNLKASMAVFAPIVLMASRGWAARGDRRRLRAWVDDNAAFVGGGVISILFVVAILGRTASIDMWRYCVEMNLGWKARVSGLPTLLGVVWRELFVTFAAVAFAAWRVWTLPRRSFQLEGRDVPWLFLGSLAAGLSILPVVWYEYFAMMAPFIALSGAMALGDWFSEWEHEPVSRYSSYVLALFTFVALFPYRAFLRADALAYVQSGSTLALSGILALAAQRAGWKREFRGSAVMCLTLVSIVPLVRVSTVLHRQDNAEQRRQLEFVLATTRSTDAVFDGYTGYGVFRPHAYYYWMIHQEVQAMLSEADKGERVVEALEARRPPIVIADAWIAMLPQTVQNYLAAHYEPTPFPVFRKRRAGAASATLLDAR